MSKCARLLEMCESSETANTVLATLSAAGYKVVTMKDSHITYSDGKHTISVTIDPISGGFINIELDGKSLRSQSELLRQLSHLYTDLKVNKVVDYRYDLK